MVPAPTEATAALQRLEDFVKHFTPLRTFNYSHILKTIDKFLETWQSNKLRTSQQGQDEESNPSTIALPDTVYRALSTLVNEIGPQDSLMRKHWRIMLRKHITTEKLTCIRRFLLDFCPSVLGRNPPIHILTEFLTAFRTAVSRDRGVLPDILQVLKRLVKFQILTQEEAFLQSMSFLKKADKEDVAILAEFCLDHVPIETAKHLSSLMNTLRSVVRSSTKDTINNSSTWILSLLSVMATAQKRPALRPSFGQYISSLEEEVHPDARVTASRPAGVNSTAKSPMEVSPMDMWILFLHHNSPTLGANAEHVLDLLHYQCSEKEDNNLPFVGWLLLVQLATHQEESCAVQKRIEEFSIWFLTFQLCFPLRHRKQLDLDRVLTLPIEFGMDLIASLSERASAECLQSLNQLDRELTSRAHRLSTSLVRSNQPKSNVHRTQEEIQAFSSISEAIREILHKGTDEEEVDVGTSRRQERKRAQPSLLGLRDMEEGISELWLGRTHHTLSKNRWIRSRSLLFSSSAEILSADREFQQPTRVVHGLQMLAYSALGDPQRLSSLVPYVQLALLPLRYHGLEPSVAKEAIETLCVSYDGNKKEDVPSKQLRTKAFQALTQILTISKLIQNSNASKGKKKGVVHDIILVDKAGVLGQKAIKENDGGIYYAFDRICSCASLVNSRNWFQTCDFVYSLIDGYLSFARTSLTRNMWQPKAWINAPFLFPSLHNVPTSKRNQKNIRILQECLDKFTSVSLSIASARSIAKMIKERFMAGNVEYRMDLLRFLRKYTLSHCVALSVAMAVLKNSFRVVQDSSLQRKNGPVTLLQSQLSTAYHLLENCERLAMLVRSIDANKRSNRRRTHTQSSDSDSLGSFAKEVSDLTRSTDQVQRIARAFVLSEKYFDRASLWLCLVNQTHDTMILNYTKMEPVTRVNDTDEEVLPTRENEVEKLVDFRLQVLSHFKRHLKQFSTSNLPEALDERRALLAKEIESTKSAFVESLNFACLLTSKIAELESNIAVRPVFKKMNNLVADYFRILLLLMTTVFHASGNDQFAGTTFAKLYHSALAVSVEGHNSSDSTTDVFLARVDACDDPAIANELLETLSALVLYAKTEEESANLVEASWLFLQSHTARAEVQQDYHLPYAFQAAFQSKVPRVARGRVARGMTPQYIQQLANRVALHRSKRNTSRSFFEQCLLRHWGLLMMLDCTSSNAIRQYSDFYAIFEKLLSELDPSSLTKHQPRQRSLSWDEDPAYIPPKSLAADNDDSYHCASDSMPSLDNKSYPACYQMVLDMSVASVAFFEVNLKRELHPETGPFGSFCALLNNFGSFLGLYLKYDKIFYQPQVLSAVAISSQNALDVVFAQIHEFALWRSHQPTAADFDSLFSVGPDPAAAEYLACVLERVEAHVMTPMRDLYASMKLIHGDEADFGRQKLRGFGAKLDKSVEKLKQMQKSLQTSPSRHLTSVSRDQESQDESSSMPRRTKRKRANAKEAAGSTDHHERKSEEHESGKQSRYNFMEWEPDEPQGRQSPNTSLPFAAARPFEDIMSTSDESSFGASGDWQDDE